MVCRTFSRSEAAELLGVSSASIVRMEEDGVINRVKGIPGARYRKRDIYAIIQEGPEECAPAAIRRLQSKLKLQEKEIERLKNVLQFIANEAMQLKEAGR